MLEKTADWCHNWRLRVNFDKRKVYIVEKYKYLGVIFDQGLNLESNSEVLSSSANRALGAAVNKYKTLGGLGFSTYTAMFNNL